MKARLAPQAISVEGSKPGARATPAGVEGAEGPACGGAAGDPGSRDVSGSARDAEAYPRFNALLERIADRLEPPSLSAVQVLESACDRLHGWVQQVRDGHVPACTADQAGQPDQAGQTDQPGPADQLGRVARPALNPDR